MINDNEAIALGTRAGLSWKVGINNKMNLNKLLEVAHTPKTGLVNGPGTKVITRLASRCGLSF